MRPVQRLKRANQSHSYTSCLYKSESEQPSISNYGLHGTRVNRLNYRKNIPLREQKSFNRLVRSRGRYDDIRARLICDSTSCLRNNPGLRPANFQHVIKTLELEKNDAIIDKDDIIDKILLVQKKNSDLCNYLGHSKKNRKCKKIYMQTYEEEQGENGEENCSRIYETYGRKYRKTIAGRMEKRCNKKGVRFKVKYVRSDPCPCANELSDFMKKNSRTMSQKMYPHNSEPPCIIAKEQYINENIKNKKLNQTSFPKYKGIQYKLDQSVKKLYRSGPKIKQKLRFHGQKKFEHIKSIRKKNKSISESNIRKFPETVHSKEKVNIKIGPSMMFSNKTKILTNNCMPDSYVVNESITFINLRRLQKHNRQWDLNYSDRCKTINQKVKINSTPSYRSTISTQIRNGNPVIGIENKNNIMKKCRIPQTYLVNRRGKIISINKTKENSGNCSLLLFKCGKNVDYTSIENNHINRKDKSLKEKKSHIVNKDIFHLRDHQLMRITSSISFEMKLYKNLPDFSSSITLQWSQSFDARNPKAKCKPEKVYRQYNNSFVIKPSLKSLQGTTERLISKLTHTNIYNVTSLKSRKGNLVSYIGQCKCKKSTRNLNNNINHSTKQISCTINNSIASTATPITGYKSKLCSCEIIKTSGSNLSLNIDFYKDNLNTDSTKALKKITTGHNLSNNKSFKIPDAISIPTPLKTPLTIKSGLNIDVDILRRLELSKKKIASNIKQPSGTSISACNAKKTHKYFKQVRQPTHKKRDINTYFKQSFYAMNVQVFNKGKLPVIKKLNTTLKPYECEPGICIPGQCDPYECQKLIKKRLAKIAQKRVGTNYINKSISSDATNDGESSSRSTQMQTHVRNTEGKIIQKYRPQSQSNPTQRQAVRIRSSFSFDLEFYKNRSQAIKNNGRQQKSVTHIEKPVNQKTIRIGPQRKKIQRKNSKFQSDVRSMHRATTPMTQRCFCTLKLQKGGRIYKDNRKLNIVATKPSSSITTKDAKIGKNTNYHKVPKYTNKLKIYECEPGICIPGQCDPYKCLELIKRRKDVGLSTIRKNKSSVSGTSTERLKRKNYAVDAIPAKTHHKQTRANKYMRDIQNDNLQISTRKPREAVRIGSNFSLNIEFFKENVNDGNEKTIEVNTHPTTNVQYKRRPKASTEKSITTKIPSSLRIRTNATQVKKRVKRSFGVSPLIKRCFCTLKLKNKSIEKIDPRRNLKQLKKNPQINTKTANTQLNKRLKDQPIKYNFSRELLSPYECEPFACTPGECNPVKCLKRIKKRQQQTKGASTNTKRHKRKSIGNIVTRTRNQNLQANQSNTILDKGVNQTTYLEKSRPNKFYNQPRQAVRIGSNFSFNIEFFKGTEVDIPKTVSNRPMEEANFQKRRKHDTNTQASYPVRNVDAQGILTKMHSTDTETAHLKRCFCTLQLKDKKLGKSSNKKQMSEHSSLNRFLKKCLCILTLNKDKQLQKQPPGHPVKYEIKGTSTHNRYVGKKYVRRPIRSLEPYECEPYVCVPGECDPYECLKRIQRRQVRNVSTGYKQHLKHTAVDSTQRPTDTRSTKVQYERRQNVNSRATSLGSKHARRNQETLKFVSRPAFDTNRQVVRIGSNFSFNVEFFKDRGLTNSTSKENSELIEKKVLAHTYLHPKNRRTKSRGLITMNPIQDESSQFTNLKKNVMTHSTHVAPKRCFCTSKLLGKPKHIKYERKFVHPPITTKDKKTATHVKYQVPFELGVYECPPLMCIPGECNPYECLNKMSRKGLKGKHRNVGTHAEKTSIASVGSRAPNYRANETQSQANRRNIMASTAHSEILKSPVVFDNSNRKNKHAVRIGSNFNFSLEFSKQKSQPLVMRVPKMVNREDTEELTKKIVKKNVTAAPKKVQNYSSQINGAKLIDQGSDAGNLLKRCFCTLQLQKPARRNFAQKARYPQIITVGRVEIDPFFNVNKKKNILKGTDKACSTHTKLHNKPVGTKIDKKYLQYTQSQCHPSICRNLLKNTFRKAISRDIMMQTERESRAFVSKKKNDVISEFKTEGLKNKTNLPKTESKFNNSIFFRCIKYFARRSGANKITPNERGRNAINNQPEQAKTRLHVQKIELKIPPKKNKTFEDTCNICPNNIDKTGKKYTKFRPINTGITVKAHTNPAKHNQIQSNTQNVENVKYPQMIDTFVDNRKKHEIVRRKKKNVPSLKFITRSKLCHHCSATDCARKFDNLDKQQKSGDFNLIKKNINKVISYSESVDNCRYCDWCKRKIHVDEINKGGGDKQIPISVQSNGNSYMCPCHIKSNNRKERKIPPSEKSGVCKFIEKYLVDKAKSADKSKPILKMQIDSSNYGIINKRELKETIAQLSKVSVTAKRTNNNMGTAHKILSAKNGSSKISKPCICGSKKCAMESKKMVISGNQKIQKGKQKPCVCGSSICVAETKIQENLKSTKKPKTKAEIIEDRKKRKALMRRIKIQENMDELKRLKRIKRNAKLDRNVKKYKNASDVLLAAENLIDIGKLGVSSLSEAVSCTVRAAADPSVACQRICKICKNKDKQSALETFQRNYQESDTVATCRRVKRRCSYMSRMKLLKEKLEGNPITHYMLHIADKNTKTRVFKPKPKRRTREPLDFQCSLYMASLRKRPFLSVYYKCPWFYPHFMTIVNVWKQFTDVILLLLAAVVWSPCILCMEGCRALMCCFFCTG